MNRYYGPRQYGFGQVAARRDPLALQNFNPLNTGNPEDFGQNLYDRVNYAAAGAASLQFFKKPIGDSVTLIQAGAATTVVKSYRDTNMQTAGIISNQAFLLMGISLGFVHEDEAEPANPTDRDKIRSGGYLHFKVESKDILYEPLIGIPEMNPYAIASTTVTATTILGTRGGGGQLMKKFPVPISLVSFTSITAEIVFSGTVTTTKAVDIYWIFHSYMRRPS